MVRLRRTSPDQPGWTRRRAGRGWSYLDEDGEPLGAEQRRAHRGPRDPAGLARRLDHAVRQRAPAGGRHRRRRAAAVPLPPRVARPPRRGEVRPDAASSARPRPGPRAGAAPTSGARACRWSGPARPRCGCSTSATSGSATTSTPTQHGSFGLTTLERRHVRRHQDLLVFRSPASRGSTTASRSTTGRSSRPSRSCGGAARPTTRAAGLQARGASWRSSCPTWSTATSGSPPGSRPPRRTSGPGTPRCSPRWRWPRPASPGAARRRASGRSAGR